MGDNTQNQDYSLVGDSAFLPGDHCTSKRFLLILFAPNTLPCSNSATHLLYSRLKLIVVCLTGKSWLR